MGAVGEGQGVLQGEQEAGAVQEAHTPAQTPRLVLDSATAAAHHGQTIRPIDGYIMGLMPLSGAKIKVLIAQPSLLPLATMKTMGNTGNGHKLDGPPVFGVNDTNTTQ